MEGTTLQGALSEIAGDGREPARELAASDGSRAALEIGEDGAERLVMRDPSARLLFAYDPSSSRCEVYVPEGDLVLRTPKGAIGLEAATEVRLQGDQAVEVRTPRLRADAATAEVTLKEARLEAELVQSTLRRAQRTVDVLETQAGRIVERARESYREVEGLAQMRAGRIRQVSERAIHLLAERLALRAVKDVKVDGEKILIG